MILFLSGIMIASTVAQAPARRGNGPGQGWNNTQQRGSQIEKMLPDLTEDQVAALQELQKDRLKSMREQRNTMGEIKARQRTIMSADPIDEKAASKLIDEKSEVQKQQMKAQLEHRLALQEILTDDQYLALEMKLKKRKQAQHQYSQGQGKGNYAERGRRSAPQGRGR